MTREWQLVEAQRDGSHEYVQADASFDTLVCQHCGKPRCFHVHDGFKPSTLPTTLSTDPGLYRGPHPAWSKPGSFSQMDRHELAKERAAQRAEIERVIAEDRAKFKAKARNR